MVLRYCRNGANILLTSLMTFVSCNKSNTLLSAVPLDLYFLFLCISYLDREIDKHVLLSSYKHMQAYIVLYKTNKE